MDDDFVVYRTGWARKQLDYVRGKEWDEYVEATPKTLCEFISRGHTLVEAINLTKLANQQKEMERNEI